MKKKAPEPENHERWLVSYADLLTLLFAFFVVMFASSQTDKTKAKQVSDAVVEALENGRSIGLPPHVAKILGGTVDDVGIGNAQMRGPGGAKRDTRDEPPQQVVELMPSMEKLNHDLEQEIRDGKLEMHMEARGLVVSLREATFFPSGDDVLDPKSLPVIDKILLSIKSLPNAISVEGHTDAIPIHNARFASNWELSTSRGISMLTLLREKYEIKPSRLSVVGYAENQPLAGNDTAEGRARNRRVDLVIKNVDVRQPLPLPQEVAKKAAQVAEGKKK